MKDKITVYLNDVRDAIDHLRKKPTNQQAYTSQIIEEYMGFFYSNVGVPVYRSWNAQFGKILKKHASMLGIKELKKAQTIKNAQRIKNARRHTQCSLWSLDAKPQNRNTHDG